MAGGFSSRLLSTAFISLIRFGGRIAARGVDEVDEVEEIEEIDDVGVTGAGGAVGTLGAMSMQSALRLSCLSGLHKSRSVSVSVHSIGDNRELPNDGFSLVGGKC